MMNQEAFVSLIVQKVMERIGKEAWFVPECEQKEAFEATMLQSGGRPVRFINQPEEADVICLLQSSAKLFAEIGKGYGDHAHTELVLEHLALGKVVYVLEEGIPYRKHAHTCPEKLYNKWLSYEDAVKAYGVKFVKRDELMTTSKTMAVAESLSQGICQVSQRVVTEKVLSLIPQHNRQSIEIGKDAIVTPLALDYIRQEQLSIKRVSERS